MVPLFLGSCKSDKIGSNKSDFSENQADGDEDFDAFYTKFISDTLFQNLRFAPSLPTNGHLDTKHLDTALFKLETIKSEQSVSERIIYKQDTSYYIHYVFKKDKGKWYVVSYKDTYGD